MTKRYISILILFFALVAIGCKDNDSKLDANGITKSSASKKTNYPLISDKGFSVDQIKKMNTSALSILEHRKSLATSNYQSLTAGVWEYDFIYQNGKMSTLGDYTGYWLDFIDNDNYEFGYTATTAGKGKYHYGMDTDLLLLVNDDNKMKPVQVKAKMAGDMLVLSGNPEYKDNGFQSKLIRLDTRPR